MVKCLHCFVFGARLARFFKGVNGLLFNLESFRRGSTFNPTMEELPSCAVAFIFDVSRHFARIMSWTFQVFLIQSADIAISGKI